MGYVTMILLCFTPAAVEARSSSGENNNALVNHNYDILLDEKSNYDESEIEMIDNRNDFDSHIIIMASHVIIII